MNTIPTQARQKLIEQGFNLNVLFYEQNGTLIQYRDVGSTTANEVVVGGIKMKRGDTWTEVLDPETWEVKVEKIGGEKSLYSLYKELKYLNDLEHLLRMQFWFGAGKSKDYSVAVDMCILIGGVVLGTTICYFLNMFL